MEDKGIIVGLNIKQDNESFYESMLELEQLCEACGIQVIESFAQKSHSIHSAYYIGPGKVEELGSFIEDKEISIVIFNNELSGSQIRNLESSLRITVLDRTALILNIFGARAKSREAKMQVEVAKLQYELPRLVGSTEYLGRQGGGSGLRNKGTGEKKLELNKRKIEERINILGKELEHLQTQRDIRSNRREAGIVPRIALVGYTNAGKSSVMNVLLNASRQKEEKQVLQKDMLFATLETATRSIKVDGYKEFLLSDTVGFVSNLPHALVKAFRSTLQEVREADLLLHIVDRSNPSYQEQSRVTNQTLEEIGAGHIPVIYVYNKLDKLEEALLSTDNAIPISATQAKGITTLLDAIQSQLVPESVEGTFLIPYTCGKEMEYLRKYANIVQLQYEDEGYRISVECSGEDYKRYEKYIV